jgi:hypothetical protein
MVLLPDLPIGHPYLILSSKSAVRDLMSKVIAQLALRGGVLVIDGGNSFDAYRIARLLRQQTNDLPGALDRIRIARGFTCYQVFALLAQIPATKDPKIILGLLDTFFDESIPVFERQRLLEQCIRHLQRLSCNTPLAISVWPPRSEQAERVRLLNYLQQALENVIVVET